MLKKEIFKNDLLITILSLFILVSAFTSASWTKSHSITISGQDIANSATASTPFRLPICAEGPDQWPNCTEDRSRLKQDYAQYTVLEERNHFSHHHTGLDIAGAAGTYVVAAAAGTVVARCTEGIATGCPGFSTNATNHNMNGVVIIRHDLPEGIRYSLYAHLTGDSVTKFTPEPGLPVSAGQRLGQTKILETAEPHVHFEIKDTPVLHNPVELSGSCIDPVSKTSSARCWGYLLNHPDQHGFHDPILFLHTTSPMVDTRVRVTDVGAAFPGVSIRVGPAGYRTPSRATIPGEEFIAFRTSEATTAPPCSLGWYQIRRPDGHYFDDPPYGSGTLPDAWVCGGNASEVWVEPVTDASKPTVATGSSSAITGTSATLGGTANPNGSATNVWFEWGTDNTLTNFNRTPSQSIGAGIIDLPISSTISGLTSSTTYYYRLVGSSSAGTTKGSILSFLTLPDTSGPFLAITSPRNGQTLTTRTITVAGNATDANRGNSGISSVTVNGVRATGDTAIGSGTASWRRAITLNPGPNPITAIALDNSPNRNPSNQSITVTYCAYSISPTSQLFGKDGGNGRVEVTAPGSCSWTARSTGWVTVTSGASGNGNGTVTYSVQANTTTSYRARTITIAGKAFSVRQAGSCRVTPITIPRILTTTLSTSDCWSPLRTGSSGPFFADRYSFSALAGQQVVISLTSSAFTTYLYLIDPNGAIIPQEVGTGRYTLPLTGTYFVEVTSSLPSKTGSYRLSVTR